MKRATSTTSLPCTPEVFWKFFFDEGYLKAFYVDELKFQSVRVIEKSDDARKIHVVPKINLPGPIAKLVGDTFAYEEHGTLDRAANLWTWRMVTGGRTLVKTHGTIRLVADGSGLKRTDDVNIESPVFAIGGLIESTAEKEVRSVWTKEPAFIARWLTTHPNGV